MRRRAFLKLALALLLTMPGALHAADNLPRIGVLVPGSPPRDTFDAFRAGLAQLGHVEGKSLVLEVRWNSDVTEAEWGPLADELVRSKVTVIVTGTIDAAEAVGRITRDIPIVAINLAEPVARRMIGSLSRPGGNVTGIVMISAEMVQKRLQLFTDALPVASRFLIIQPGGPLGEWMVGETQAAARILGVHTEAFVVRGPADLPAAFDAAARGGAHGVLLLQNALFRIHGAEIAALGRARGMAVMSGETGFARQGGLMEFGHDVRENWRRAAAFVDKIIKGAKPADLPVEQPARVGLVVNLLTAKALAITIPESITTLADEVIQ